MFNKLDAEKIKVKSRSSNKVEFSYFLNDRKQIELAAGKKALKVTSALEDWKIEKSKDGYTLTLTLETISSVPMKTVVDKFRMMVS